MTFARARRGKLFKGEAACGRCASKNQVSTSLVTGSGIITSCMLTPANIEEHSNVKELTEGIHGLVIGDRRFIRESLNFY